MPKWLKILLIVIASFFVAVIAFVVIITMVVGVQTKDAEVVSDKVIDAIQANDAADVYTETSSAFQEVTTQQELSALISSISPSLQGSEKIIARKSQTTNGVRSAAIVYEVPTSNGTEYVRVVLVDDNGWKVQNFLVSATKLEADIE